MNFSILSPFEASKRYGERALEMYRNLVLLQDAPLKDSSKVSCESFEGGMG